MIASRFLKRQTWNTIRLKMKTNLTWTKKELLGCLITVSAAVKNILQLPYTQHGQASGYKEKENKVFVQMMIHRRSQTLNEACCYFLWDNFRNKKENMVFSQKVFIFWAVLQNHFYPLSNSSLFFSTYKQLLHFVLSAFTLPVDIFNCTW